MRKGLSIFGLLSLAAALGTCAIVLIFLSAAVVGGARRLDGGTVYFGIPTALLGTMLFGTMLTDWLRNRGKADEPTGRAWPPGGEVEAGAMRRWRAPGRGIASKEPEPRP